jgi:hypothetical protein
MCWKSASRESVREMALDYGTAVTKASRTTRSFQQIGGGVLQRACACGKHGGTGGECESCQKKRLGMQRAAINRAVPDLAPPIVHEVLRGAGRPLDEGTRMFMESRLGQDFSRVRVHTDARAAESAQAVNALAYTVGKDVVFGTGQYVPSTKEGQRLVAHELTHVQQQSCASTSPSRSSLKIRPSNTPNESEAALVSDSLSRPPYSVSALQNLNSTRPSPATLNGSLYTITTSSIAIQREEVCEPDSEPGGNEVIYDYENQVCRLPEPDEVGISIPEYDTVDGEFWRLPTGVRKGAKAIYDDEETGVVVGFRYSSGGYYEIYDLEGKLIESGEPGLEAPLIDPIDILAGGLTGLGRSAVRSGTRSIGRGIVATAERSGIAALARTGLVASIRMLGKSAAAALRGVYRAVRFRGVLNFTATTAARMADPARRVPLHILKLAIRFGKREIDPQGVAGAFRYSIQMFRNGTEYTLEVVLRETDQTVLHFLYR